MSHRPTEQIRRIRCATMNYERDYQKIKHFFEETYSTIIYGKPKQMPKKEEHIFKAGYLLARLQQENQLDDFTTYIKSKESKEVSFWKTKHLKKE